MAVLFEIYLKSVLVIENGKANEKVEGVNALSANLLYPREGVPSVTSMRSIKLKDKEELDLERIDIRQRFLFKEIVRGHSLLEVEITAIEKVTKFEKLIHKIFSSSVDAAISAVPGIGSIVTGAIKIATNSIFQGSEPADRVMIIGNGFAPLNESTPEGDFVVNLTVPYEVAIYQRTLNDAGDTIEKKITLPAGFTNAKVVFDIKKLPV